MFFVHPCCRRENTVLRGHLFEPSAANPDVPEVRKSVYVIPNSLVAEQFKPIPKPPSDTSMGHFDSSFPVVLIQVFQLQLCFFHDSLIAKG